MLYILLLALSYEFLSPSSQIWTFFTFGIFTKEAGLTPYVQFENGIRGSYGKLHS